MKLYKHSNISPYYKELTDDAQNMITALSLVFAAIVCFGAGYFTCWIL